MDLVASTLATPWLLAVMVVVTVLLVSGVVSVGCRLFWSAVKVWVWKSWWSIFVVFIGAFDMPRPAVEAWALHVLHCCLVDLLACAIEWLGAEHRGCCFAWSWAFL